MRKRMRTLWVVLCCLTVAAGYAQEVVKENGKNHYRCFCHTAHQD